MIEFFKELFQKMFGKKGVIKEVTDDVSDLMSEYKKIAEDIKYLDAQQETFILTSLDRDFPMVKDTIVELFNRMSNNSRSSSRWAPDHHNVGASSTTIRLAKYRVDNSYTSTGDKISITFTYNNKIDAKFEISSLSVSVDSKSVSVSLDKFINILYKYVMAYEIALYKKSLNSAKDSFSSMMNILGTEVKRDSKIDAILN